MCDYASHRAVRKCLKRSSVNPEAAEIKSLFDKPEKKHTGTEFLEDVVR